MTGLSSEDLAFFDTHQGGSSTTSGKTQALNITSDFDDDDGFGDFVQYDTGEAKQQDIQNAPIIQSSGLGLIGLDLGSSQEKRVEMPVPVSWPVAVPTKKSSPASYKPKPSPVASENLDLLGLSDFSPTIRNEKSKSPIPDTPPVISSTATPAISIQSQAADLSSFTPTIRFGQHLEKQSGSLVPTQSTSLDQWNNILSALPGPTGSTTVRSPPQDDGQNLTKVQTVQASAPDAPLPSPIEHSLSNTSQPPEEAFEDFDDFDDFNDFSKASSIPPSNQLIAYYHSNIITLLNKFFDDLVPVSYTLKKRTIARPETKIFLNGFFEAIRVAGRIMTGRSRTAIDDSQLAQADRESRELARVWKEELTGRLKSLLPPSMLSDIPSLDARLTVSSKSVAGKEYCPICGLSKTELVKGSPRPEWDNASQGHKTCLAFWDKRSTFGIN